MPSNLGIELAADAYVISRKRELIAVVIVSAKSFQSAMVAVNEIPQFTKIDTPVTDLQQQRNKKHNDAGHIKVTNLLYT